jgi:short-subunit dehydrogenase
MKILQSKRAIITGGSDGIGFSIAKAFVENGADVVLIARDKKKLDKAYVQLSASNNNNEIIGISADLSSISAIDQLAAQLTLTWPEIDILVNNAGTACFLPFADISQTEVDLLINLNIKAPFVLTQQLMAALERRKGNIINISSYFSHRMIPGRHAIERAIRPFVIDRNNWLFSEFSLKIG